MAKVSLRIYNREIEGLVDQGHTDEAIAHCRHILKTFPKHLETYRLLGKAYLEARRYGEAVDIFSRVLASVPEDFVSHVGMSIINDEQNQLDNAIWHMERAFEAQPSNAAIQGELQRLYGRRDGMEPPKVRMTRGALAHMYVQGELYPQAIAEIKAVLAQDAQRTDLQVLLAKAYFKSGQKMEAKELCAQLLKKSLYCFDANRIMLEFLHANPSAAENTQVYRMRVGELDPYANASKESVFQSNEVPDAAINLEKLEYTGQEVPIGQEWSSSLGIHAGDSGLATSAVEPDWLRGADAASTPQADIFAAVQPIETQAAQPADDIPDFLRAAGWGASTGPEQPTSFFDAEDATASAPSSNEDLVSASIPDWLKGQMPTESAPPVADESAEPTADVDWLNSLTTAAQQNSQASHGEMPDWLSGGDSQTTSAPESAPEQPLTKNADVPDWLAGLEDSPAESAPLASAPDWLAGLDDSKPAQNASTENKLDVPDWLSGLDDQPATTNESQPVTSQTPANIESLGASAQEQDDAVAWLESLAAKHGAKPEELVTDPNKRSETAPEWVQQASAANEAQPVTSQTPANIESLGASAQEQDDAVAWLESLAAKHGAKPEELVTDPNKRSETAPEWVQQASAANEAQPVATQPAANIESLGASAQEQDDAVAWLESLAAKHGAKPEELVTDPNKRSETAPEWVQQASAANEAQSVTSQPETEKIEISENAKNIGEQFFAEFEDASSAQPATDDTATWLKDLDEKSSQPAQDKDLPDWMRDKTSDSFVSQNLSQDDLANWLDNLDGGETQPVAQFVAPEKDDLPNWLSGVDTTADAQSKPETEKTVEPVAEEKPAQTPLEPAPVSDTADIPAWLQGVDEENSSASQAADDDDNTPPWLRRESWEVEEQTAAPKPVTSADWHPMESANKKPVEAIKPVAQEAKPKAQAPAKPQPAQKPAKKPAEKREPQSSSAALSQAKSELDRGDIPAALEHYEKLIKKGKHLEETIRDLTESIYRYPVEVGIWQTLGDAYMRANRLKEALEAYNKAEELIR